MAKPLLVHEDRLFSSDPAQRGIARELYALVKDYPILSPHGHTDPAWFADNHNFGDATELFLAPDHYIYRMLYSQGIAMEDVGVGGRSGPSKADARTAWRLFAKNWRLFRGTPTAMCMSYVFNKIMGFEVQLGEDTADFYFDRIGELLASDAYKPRALFESFNIELLATTEGWQAPDDRPTPEDILAHWSEVVANRDPREPVGSLSDLLIRRGLPPYSTMDLVEWTRTGKAPKPPQA